ncbi:MAG: flagellar motor switch phosphatase FliY, partial [Clostridium sp.]|nr:flagellar motor switch phosphatase FliY [Clostridium sp.]
KAATSMATLYDTMVDISTPDVHKIDVESVKTFEKMFESNSEKFIKISFRIEVSDVIDSTMVQLYPVSFAMEMVEKFRQRKAAGAIGKE